MCSVTNPSITTGANARILARIRARMRAPSVKCSHSQPSTFARVSDALVAALSVERAQAFEQAEPDSAGIEEVVRALSLRHLVAIFVAR